ncbi:MAG: hypothetical protein WAL75_06425 [Terracidiphilus sp.]
MTKSVKSIIFGLMLSALCAAKAQTIKATSCNTSDVQSAINTATEGQTVAIPAGTCTWTTGVTISGKGIVVAGAGSGRIIADSTTTQATIGTGSKTWTITSARVDGTFPLGPTAGQSLIVYELGTIGNYMAGTVTSYSGGTLVMNITSSAGSCADNSQSNCSRWLITTLPSTTIINNTTAGVFAFTIKEDTAFDTNLSGIQLTVGTGTGGGYIAVNTALGGLPVLINNLWLRGADTMGTLIHFNDNRGVVWNVSVDASPFCGAEEGVQLQADGITNSWTTASTWGAADTSGTNAVYVETSDFHALLNTFDNDNNGRLVWRYNIMDNASATTHGADTSFYGERYFEYYNNVNTWYDDNTPATFNLGHGWIFVRGGSFVAFNNTWTPISGYYNGADLNMTVMNLQRNTGTGTSCWGAGYSTPGQYYHAPRQVGFGRVTGAGTATYLPDGLNLTSIDLYTYVGDSEPAYIWNNNPSNTYSISNYGSGQTYSCPASPTLDSSANYIVLNRDFYVGTAKPGYTPYTYPHPLTVGSQATPAPPVNVQATVN